MLDTNIVSDLVRHPRGQVAERIAAVGEENVCTSVVVTAELRFGAAQKSSVRLTTQVEAVIGLMDIVALEPPVDAIYAELRARLERRGRLIGANDLFIAAQALAIRCVLVTDNEREFSQVDGLQVENWIRD